MKKGSLRWVASFFHLCLTKGPRSTNPGQGGHPYSFPAQLAPTVLICGILAQNQSLDQEWGRGRRGPSPCCWPQSHVLLMQCSPEGLGGLGSVSASASPPLPAPQEPVPSLEKGSIVLSCAPP